VKKRQTFPKKNEYTRMSDAAVRMALQILVGVVADDNSRLNTLRALSQPPPTLSSLFLTSAKVKPLCPYSSLSEFATAAKP
jgi:hypothetical protein